MTQIQESPAWTFQVCHTINDADYFRYYDNAVELYGELLRMKAQGVELVSVARGAMSITRTGEVAFRWYPVNMEFSRT